jgi:hypothetical protein
MTLLVAPIIIAAGIAALGSAITAGLANRRSKKEREWALEDYQRQRQDFLIDAANQNVYNAPRAEMARLKAAGLSPTMMYGAGAAGLSDAARVQGASIKQTSAADYTGAINSLSSAMQTAVMDPSKTKRGFEAGVLNLEANARKANADADYYRIQADEETLRADIAKQMGIYGQDKILSTQLKQMELNAQARLNEINEATKEEQKKKIVQDAALAYENAVQAQWNNEQNPTRKEILGQQLEQAKTLSEIMQSQKNQEYIKATLAQYNIFPTDEWYLRAAALIAGKIKALEATQNINK